MVRTHSQTRLSQLNTLFSKRNSKYIQKKDSSLGYNSIKAGKVNFEFEFIVGFHVNFISSLVSSSSILEFLLKSTKFYRGKADLML